MAKPGSFLSPVAREFLLLAAGLALALLGSELFLRRFSPQSMMTPAYEDRNGMRVFRSYTRIKHLTPAYRVVYTTNAMGFRGPLYPAKKPAGIYRIAVLGPSFTFGFGVDDEDTYARRLERLLNKDAPGGGRYEVMNFGWPGIPLNAFLPFYRDTVSRYDPDLILIHLHNGSMDRAVLSPIDRVEGNDPTSTSKVVGLRRWLRRLRYVPGYAYLCENSHLWALMRLRAAANLDSMGRDETRAASGRVEDAEELERLWASTFDAFYHEVCDGRKRLRVLATVVPAHIGRWPLVREHLARLAASDPRFRLVELNFASGQIFIGDPHWNAAGHAYVARVLNDALEPGARKR